MFRCFVEAVNISHRGGKSQRPGESMAKSMGYMTLTGSCARWEVPA